MEIIINLHYELILAVNKAAQTSFFVPKLMTNIDDKVDDKYFVHQEWGKLFGSWPPTPPLLPPEVTQCYSLV